MMRADNDINEVGHTAPHLSHTITIRVTLSVRRNGSLSDVIVLRDFETNKVKVLMKLNISISIKEAMRVSCPCINQL